MVSGFGTFATVPGMQEGRAGAAIAPLPNGGALIAGGFAVTIDPATANFGLAATATADVFAQGPNLLTPTGAMLAPRLFPTTAAQRGAAPRLPASRQSARVAPQQGSC